MPTRSRKGPGLAALALAVLASGCGSTLDSSPAGSPSQPARLTLTADPAVLTLPTGAFHYDPLLTLRNANGEAMWVDLPAEIRAVSSNLQVATVNQRVRIRTTDVPGSADIDIHTVVDPAVRTTVKLTTVEAAIEQVRVEGPTSFDMYVGQGMELVATAVLTNGAVIPHAEYSSDLDVVRGSEYAAIVDGVGISALRASPRDTPIAVGFRRGGGTARATLSVREMRLVDVQVELGGSSTPSRSFTIPSGYSSVLALVGTFEDGTSRPLRVNQDYTVATIGDSGFTFTAPGPLNGFLTQPLAGRTTTLQIDIRDELGPDVVARATTVDGSLVTGLSADFENYSEDDRLLYAGEGYARELKVLADFPGLSGYRVSGLDPLSATSPVAARGLATTGWPTLTPATPAGSGDVQLALAGTKTTLPAVTVVTPRVLTVHAVEKRPVARFAIELGSHLSFATLVDYGDGRAFNRTRDYPVVATGAQAAGQPFFSLLGDLATFFLNMEGEVTFQARDAEDRGLQTVGPEAHATVLVGVARQSNPD